MANEVAKNQQTIDLVKEAHKALYKAQLSLAKVLEEKSNYPLETDHWCHTIQDLMDEMEDSTKYMEAINQYLKDAEKKDT